MQRLTSWFRPRKYWSGKIWLRAWLLTIWNQVSGTVWSGCLCPCKGLLISEFGQEQTVLSQGLFFPVLLPYWTTEILALLGKLGSAVLCREMAWPFGRKQWLNCHGNRFTSVGEKLHSDFPDGIVIRLASRTSSLLGDRTLFPFPILLGTNMIDGAVDALGTLTEPYLRVGRTTLA